MTIEITLVGVDADDGQEHVVRCTSEAVGEQFIQMYDEDGYYNWDAKTMVPSKLPDKVVNAQVILNALLDDNPYEVLEPYVKVSGDPWERGF
jgi:hypothetical protein